MSIHLGGSFYCDFTHVQKASTFCNIESTRVSTIVHHIEQPIKQLHALRNWLIHRHVKVSQKSIPRMQRNKLSTLEVKSTTHFLKMNI